MVVRVLAVVEVVLREVGSHVCAASLSAFQVIRRVYVEVFILTLGAFSLQLFRFEGFL